MLLVCYLSGHTWHGNIPDSILDSVEIAAVGQNSLRSTLALKITVESLPLKSKSPETQIQRSPSPPFLGAATPTEFDIL